MKALLEIFRVYIIAIVAIFPGMVSASFWNVTFTANNLNKVGVIDNGETISEGDPELFFAMQINVAGSVATQVFFRDSYVSATDWDFPDTTISLTNVFTSSTSPPEVLFSFWLYDDDGPLIDPYLLGIHSFLSDINIAPVTSPNDNFRWLDLPIPLAYAGSGSYGNFLLNYSVTIEAVPVPAAAWLFGSGLIGLFVLARRVSKKDAWIEQGR